MRTGILQPDAYDGYKRIYLGAQSQPIPEAACRAHARHPFFAMADIEENARRKAAGKKEIALSPIATDIVRRVDTLFEIERSINVKNEEPMERITQSPVEIDLRGWIEICEEPVAIVSK